MVGGGDAGTKTAACPQRLTHHAVRRCPRLDPGQISRYLLKTAPKPMPELFECTGAYLTPAQVREHVRALRAAG